MDYINKTKMKYLDNNQYKNNIRDEKRQEYLKRKLKIKEAHLNDNIDSESKESEIKNNKRKKK